MHTVQIKRYEIHNILHVCMYTLENVPIISDGTCWNRIPHVSHRTIQVRHPSSRNALTLLFLLLLFFFSFFFSLPPYAYRATFEYIVYFVIPNKRFIITILGSWGLTAHRGHSLVGNWRGYHELGSCFGVIWGSNLVKTRGWVNSHRCTTSTFILLTMQSCGLRMLNQTSLPSSVCKNTLFALLICMQPKDG